MKGEIIKAGLEKYLVKLQEFRIYLFEVQICFCRNERSNKGTFRAHLLAIPERNIHRKFDKSNRQNVHATRNQINAYLFIIYPIVAHTRNIH